MLGHLHCYLHLTQMQSPVRQDKGPIRGKQQSLSRACPSNDSTQRLTGPCCAQTSYQTLPRQEERTPSEEWETLWEAVAWRNRDFNSNHTEGRTPLESVSAQEKGISWPCSCYFSCQHPHPPWGNAGMEGENNADGGPVPTVKNAWRSLSLSAFRFTQIHTHCP